MSSSNSSEIEDQLTMAFQGVIEEAMSMLQAEEAVAAAASSSTRGPKRHRRYINRDREVAHFRLRHDYFDDDCVYPSCYFRRRYRMRRAFFLSIMHKFSETSPYFSERYDATGHTGLTALQKCTAALRQLAYGMTAYTIDEYLKLGKTTAIECLEYYCSGIIECFGDELLRRPTVADTQRLLAKAEEREFRGMLGSIDCMHWQWHNCPVGWQGQFTQGASNILQSSLKLLLLMTVDLTSFFWSRRF
jgi:hypothetical protein